MRLRARPAASVYLLNRKVFSRPLFKNAAMLLSSHDQACCVVTCSTVARFGAHTDGRLCVLRPLRLTRCASRYPAALLHIFYVCDVTANLSRFFSDDRPGSSEHKLEKPHTLCNGRWALPPWCPSRVQAQLVATVPPIWLEAILIVGLFTSILDRCAGMNRR